MLPVLATIAAVAALIAGVVLLRGGRRRPAAGVLVVAVAATVVAVAGGAMPDPDKLADDLASSLGRWVYLAVAVLAFAETAAFVGLIAPGETVLLVGGLSAQRGVAELDLVLLVAWGSSLAGDVAGYLLGARLGTGWLERHGPRFGATASRVDRIHAFTARHGRAALFGGRFIGFVRPLVPFVAGTAGMRLRDFLPVSVLSTGVWSSAYVVAGYLAAGSIEQGGATLAAAGLGIAAIAAVTILVRRRGERFRCTREERCGLTGGPGRLPGSGSA